MAHAHESGIIARRSAIFRYGVAGLAVAAATAMRLPLEPVLGFYSPYLPFTLAVIVASRFGGRGPGLAATGLSLAAVDYFFLGPGYSLGVEQPHALAGLALFAIVGTIISFLIGQLRHSLVSSALNEERLRLAQTKAQVGIWDRDLRTGETRFTPELERAYGLDPGTIKTYEDWRRRVHPDDIGKIEAARDEALARHKRFDYEFRIIESSGEVRWMSASGGGIYDQAGKVVRVLGVNADITERKRMEQALRESEQRLRVATLAAGIGIWSWTPGTSNVIVSANWRHLFGIPPDADVTFETWRDALDPADRERAVNELKAASEQHREFNTEYRVVRPDGSVRWVVDRGRASYDENGRAIGMAGVNVDITELKRAEQAVRESEAQFRTLADAIPQLCWMANAEGWTFWYNQRWYDYTGTKPGQMEGWGWKSVHDPEVLPKVLDRWKASIATGRPFEMVFPLRGADGVFRPFLTRIMPVRDSGGKIARWFGTCTDISELRRTEEALRQVSEQRRLALEAGELGAWDYHLNTGDVFWDERCRTIFGVPAGDQIDYDSAIRCMHPEDRAAVDRAVKRAIAGADGGAYHREFRVCWPAGSVHWVASHGRAHFEGEGNERRAVRLVGVSMDITERKQAEEEIRQLNAELERRVHERTAELEAANKELEAFAYSVSHDLRAPLRGIDGWSLALVEDYRQQLDERARQYLDRVRSETQRMGLLIDDLLQLSRITRAEMQRGAVDLTSLAETVAARLREAHAGREIEFIIRPGLKAAGDARLLEIALTNLLGNAVKFTGPRVQARVEFGHAERDGERAFYIRDNGVGFDMAYADTLFGAFQRLHKSSEFPGAGIGLATVQRIIRRHGGRVWAEAQPGQGATFYFTIGEAAK